MNIQITRFDSVGSTNDEALKMAKAGAREGICVVAGAQSAGRGREGRAWHSEAGTGLYLSLLLRPSIEIRQLPILTLISAVGVHDSILELTGIRPDIKWPNDILVNGKKICGMLAETCDTGEGTAVIMGVGVNLTTEGFPPRLREKSTSIYDETGMKAAFDMVLRSVLDNVVLQYKTFNTARDVAQVIKAWSGRSSYSKGRMVVVRTRHNTFSGKTEGLDGFGSLLVRKENGTLVTVTAGDVVALRADSVTSAIRDRDVKND